MQSQLRLVSVIEFSQSSQGTEGIFLPRHDLMVPCMKWIDIILNGKGRLLIDSG